MSAKQTVKSIISPGIFIMVSVGDETYQITRDNKNFAKIEALVKAKKWDEVFNILGAKRTINHYSEGNITIEGDQVLYKGKPVSNYVAEKIVAMISEGSSDFVPLARFLDKVMESQYEHVKEHLFKFLEYGNIPLTADGNFLGYKSVRDDYRDVHSGKFTNHPGTIVRMDRSKVVSDPNQACSSGLHVGVKQYVDGFGGSKTVVVMVDPRNVVSVPYDYGHQKMRTCEYYVVSDFVPSEPLSSEVYQVDEIPADAPVSTGETTETKSSVSVAVAKAPVIKKYTANVPRLRGPDGRFIKKPVKQRDSKGRFISK